MPGPVSTTAPGVEVNVDAKVVHLMRIFVDPDGNGAVEVPHDGTLTVIKVPGSALSILATLRASGRGFRMTVSDGSFITRFLALIA